MLTLDQTPHPFGTVIKIIGVGGSGGNAVNTMIERKIDRVEFIAANTDAQDLQKSLAGTKVPLGKKTTKGQGAGSNPSIGKEAAVEAEDDIRAMLEGTDMVFIAAGMGGGTGTGAAPVIARIAREMGILTLGIVTRPFPFEGIIKARNASQGISELRENVDTLIVIPNEKLLQIYSNMRLDEGFRKADEVIYEAAKAVSDIINKSGYMNVDFADVKAVMLNMGYALMGTGVAEGEGRAAKAAKAAITNPLLSDVALGGCQALLMNITAGYDVLLSEFEEVTSVVTNETGLDANIITGLILNEQMEGKISVTIIATGLKCGEEAGFEHQKTILHYKSEDQKKEEITEMLTRIRGNSDSKTTELPIDKKNDVPSFMNNKADMPSFMKKFCD